MPRVPRCDLLDWISLRVTIPQREWLEREATDRASCVADIVRDAIDDARARQDDRDRDDR